jgi:hypothetical protein
LLAVIMEGKDKDTMKNVRITTFLEYYENWILLVILQNKDTNNISENY